MLLATQKLYRLHLTGANLQYSIIYRSARFLWYSYLVKFKVIQYWAKDWHLLQFQFLFKNRSLCVLMHHSIHTFLLILFVLRTFNTEGSTNHVGDKNNFFLNLMESYLSGLTVSRRYLFIKKQECAYKTRALWFNARNQCPVCSQLISNKLWNNDSPSMEHQKEINSAGGEHGIAGARTFTLVCGCN